MYIKLPNIYLCYFSHDLVDQARLLIITTRMQYFYLLEITSYLQMVVV